MAKNQTQKIKREKYRSEEQEEIIRFVWILVIIIILILGVYLFTKVFVTKDLSKNDNSSETTPGQIDYNTTLIGSMFTKPEKEYYVFIFDTEDVKSVYYSGLITAYKKNKDALRVYTVDLNNELNKKYIDEDNINVNTNNLESFKVGKLALLKIANGKIDHAYTKEEDIIKLLEYVKDAK